MASSRKKKPTAPTTAATSRTSAEPKPMDDAIREEAVGSPSANNRRVCWAIKQLVTEVTALFPETEAEYSNYDGRNTALDVTLHTALLPETDRADLFKIMQVLPADEYNRVWKVEQIDPERVLVRMHPRPRTQDIREQFGIEGVYMILAEDSDEQDGSI